VNDCIRHRIRPYAEAHLPDLSEYTLFCDPAIWAQALDIVLDGLNPMAHRRKMYLLDKWSGVWRSRVPEGYKMVRIDEALFSRDDLEGTETMREWLLGDWRAAAYFDRQEIGFCMVRGDELVSWCASEHICEPIPGSGKMCHISIYTREGYRKQGFATLVASATVERCVESGIDQVGWHCWESNVASAATAERVGFRLLHDQTVYNGCWNQFDNLLLQAYYFSQAGDMREAVVCWERAFEMWEARDPEALSAPHCKAHPGTVGWCYYAAGRARATWGEIDAALAHLRKAIDNGWQDKEQLQKDQVFADLHGMSGWDELLSRLTDANI
jgi:RimJ/RimL family protein N-acetyltransferase